MKIGETIYLDHQATTPIDSDVLAEMMPHFTEAFGNPHSSDHSIGWEAARAVDIAADRVAQLIGADADEIVFTSGATESNNLALLGLGHRAAGGKRRRILVTAIEHKCVLAAARILQERSGFTVEQIPVDGEGFVDCPALEETLDSDVLAVSIMAVNNEIGTIQDIEKLSGLVRGCGALFHCDAAQAPVAMDLSQIAKQVDLLSISGHKMYGPKGIGAIYVSRDCQDRIEPLIHGGGQQSGLRSGTVPVPLCVGLGAAATLFTADGAGEKRARLRLRRDRFIERLRDLGWLIALNGPLGSSCHPGNANVRFTGFAAHDILGALQPRLAASTGSACTSGFAEPSHVLRAIGLNNDDAEASIRFSLGFSTTDEHVEEAVVLISDALERLSVAEIRRTA